MDNHPELYDSLSAEIGVLSEEELKLRIYEILSEAK